jgi:hypothetical protein
MEVIHKLEVSGTKNIINKVQLKQIPEDKIEQSFGFAFHPSTHLHRCCNEQQLGIFLSRYQYRRKDSLPLTFKAIRR